MCQDMAEKKSILDFFSDCRFARANLQVVRRAVHDALSFGMKEVW